MFDGLTFLKNFDEPALDWLFEHVVERQVISRTVLVEEGRESDAVFIVANGLVGVYIGDDTASPVAHLGPGELFGEISLLEASPATATVRALENSLLLAIPSVVLREHLAADIDFAAQWYRAVALVQSQRLRDRVAMLTERLRSAHQLAERADAAWQPVLGLLNEFKTKLRDLDQRALKHGEFDDETRQATCAQFQTFIKQLNDMVGDESSLPEHVRQEIGTRIGAEILPYLLLTCTAERFYSKPRGYAGDFLTIEFIYQNRPNGSQRLGPLIDHWFLESSSAKAVRNRRGLLAREIRRTCESVGDEPARLCTLACGPAEEVFDVLAVPTLGAKVQSTLIDIDSQALAFVREKAAAAGCEDRMRLIEGNLVYLAAGRQKIADLAPQDLVYSIGLIDYFNDKWVVKLINYIHALLRPGGRVILGNFHPANPTKAFMDHVLDWKLIHRGEADMNRLYRQSKFGRECTNIWFEDEGINLFAECIKVAASPA